MTHTYKISGMTCEGCVAKVTYLLKQLPEVKDVAVNLAEGTATITMSNHIPTMALKEVFKDYPKYWLSETGDNTVHEKNIFNNPETIQKSWLQTYKPIVLIFGYVTVISLIAGYSNGSINTMTAMRVFMSGFFLTFSFFKLLDIKGFANSYAMYDIVAKKFRSWGYIYVFTELTLGLAYAVNFNPVLTNTVTAIVMSVSLIGVLQTVLNKQKIQCACLGAVFNLPMTTVTIIEDGLMILMSLYMLNLYL